MSIELTLEGVKDAIERHLKEHGYEMQKMEEESMVDFSKVGITSLFNVFGDDELILYGILPLICELTGQDHPDSDEERRLSGWLG
tara:strand:+ start:895 stop:1149 length:255 start_codon:yes stop_codon:yes gene_type:complete